MAKFRLFTASVNTPQSEPLPGQVANNAGGYSYPIDVWGKLDRFLVLGAEGGTFYVSQQKLARDNTRTIQDLIRQDGYRVVHRTMSLLQDGRLPRMDPALFVLALASAEGNEITREAVYRAIPNLNTGTHLLHFVHFANDLRGWSRGLRRAVANWYTTRPAKSLAYQVSKYQDRDGFSQRDAIRLSHPVAADTDVNAVLHWVVKGWESVGEQPHDNDNLVGLWAFERAKQATSSAEIIGLIRDYRLTHEMIPTRWLAEADVWEALLAHMPMMAMVRNLARMTRIGLLTQRSDATKEVVARLQTSAVRNAKVHPMAILLALKTYASGQGQRSDNTWTPIQKIVDALDDAFYMAFANVEPTGKRHLLALDISGSMGYRAFQSGMSCREASAALALITMATEPQCDVVGFSDGQTSRFEASNLIPLSISPGMRLDAVVKAISDLPFGGTDCALPFLWATEQKREYDAVLIYTDNETWCGEIHPSKALATYRQQVQRPVRSIVLAMTATDFTIADPDDRYSLDIAGFDAAVPTLIHDFVGQD